MSSILKPPLGMRKHMDTTHSPQSSLVHECQNLTNPPPHGQNWCNKKQQIPHPLGHKKVPKPLVTPINAPYFPGVGGVGVSIDRCISSKRRAKHSQWNVMLPSMLVIAQCIKKITLVLSNLCKYWCKQFLLAIQNENVLLPGVGI